MSVWVNGAMIEITMADGWSGRLTAGESAALPAAFTQAIDAARGWAARWDGAARSYHPESVTA
jgi:hypothetical protein